MEFVKVSLLKKIGYAVVMSGLLMAVAARAKAGSVDSEESASFSARQQSVGSEVLNTSGRVTNDKAYNWTSESFLDGFPRVHGSELTMGVFTANGPVFLQDNFCKNGCAAPSVLTPEPPSIELLLAGAFLLLAIGFAGPLSRRRRSAIS